MSEVLLEVKDLSVHYGAIQALRGVSLAVPRGKVVALIGANGAGKTTTLRAVSRMLKASTGTIRFGGEEVGRLPSHALVARGMAHAPEGRGIFLNLTVKENLDLGAYLRTDREGIERDALRVFQLFPVLKERRTQVAGTLSGGEQQMLAVGRALMSRPRLMLLDEPSLGLAPQVVERIFAAECAQGSPARAPRLRPGDGERGDGGDRAGAPRLARGAPGLPGGVRAARAFPGRAPVPPVCVGPSFRSGSRERRRAPARARPAAPPGRARGG